MAVCSQIHTKHINTLCGLNVEFVNVKPGGTYSSHWALKGYMHINVFLVFSKKDSAISVYNLQVNPYTSEIPILFSCPDTRVQLLPILRMGWAWLKFDAINIT